MEEYNYKGAIDMNLTIEEKNILENIADNYKYIARDELGVLYIYKKRPKKYRKKGIWFSKKFDKLGFNYLFHFIRWENKKPTSIKRELKVYEQYLDFIKKKLERRK